MFLLVLMGPAIAMNMPSLCHSSWEEDLGSWWPGDGIRDRVEPALGL